MTSSNEERIEIELAGALRNCEERYRTLTDMITVGVFRLSPAPDFRILFANWMLAIMLGYAGPQEIKGKRLHDFFTPNSDIENISSLLSSGSIWSHDVHLRRKDGSDIWVTLTAKTRTGPDNSIIGIDGFCEDVTERKVYEMEMQYHESELNRYALALTHANKKLNLLSSVTRHDILNQLTALGVYLDLMKTSVTDPTQVEYLTNGERISDTIRKQIEFTRDYQDIGIQTPHWHDIKETITRAIATLPVPAGMLTINVNNLKVYADPLLEKVFYNLVENAIRHGQHLTKISFSYQPSENGIALLCEDNGEGVPAEHKEAIFNRKFFKHTGFGLFLSREILGITGLSIRETGEPGKGARFEILVPHEFYTLGNCAPDVTVQKQA